MQHMLNLISELTAPNRAFSAFSEHCTFSFFCTTLHIHLIALFASTCDFYHICRLHQTCYLNSREAEYSYV